MHQRVTIVYVIFLCIGFVAQLGMFDRGEEALQAFGLKAGTPTLLQLITYSLLHLRPDHLLINLGIIAFFGAFLETRLGARVILLLLVSAPISAGISHLLLAGGDPRSLHGASGLAFALVTASILIAARKRETLMFGIALVAAILAGTGTAAMIGDPAAVSHAAHFGGALAGVVVAGLIQFPWIRVRWHD